MDESGDLGFKKASSNVFVVSYITTNDPKILQRSLKKLRQRKLKKKMRELPEFKFYTASDRVKDLMFNKIEELNVVSGYVVVNKNKIYPGLRRKRKVLYNYLFRQLLDDVITLYGHERKITLILDRLYNNKHLRDSMNEYLGRMASRISGSDLEILHKNSCDTAGLQFVDFICGAIWRHYEKGDNRYMQGLKFTTKKELFF